MSEENKVGSNLTEYAEEQEDNIAVATEYQQTETPTQSNNKFKKNIILVAITVIALLAGIVLVVNVIIPAVKYSKASDLMQAGSYNEAIIIFDELADYKDSQALKAQAAVKAKIEEAQKLYQSGKKLEAYKHLYSDKSNEEVAKILNRYKEEILAEFEDEIYWDEDDMSDYHWAYSYREDSSLALIYLAQNKNDPSENYIRFSTSFIELSDNAYSFVTPVHPNTIRIKGENGMVDISISLNDRKFTSLSDLGYKLNGWKEDIDVEISFEKMKEIINIIGNAEEITIRATGASKHSDDYSSDVTGLKNIADYIKAVYIINGLA